MGSFVIIVACMSIAEYLRQTNQNKANKEMERNLENRLKKWYYSNFKKDTEYYTEDDIHVE